MLVKIPFCLQTPDIKNPNPPPPPPLCIGLGQREAQITMSFSLITLNSVVFSVLFLQQHLLLLKLVAAVGRCEHAP